MRFSALGDVAMTIPVIYSLAEKYPDVEFTILTQKVPSKLFFAPPPNVRAMYVETKDLHRGFWGIFKLFSHLRSYHFDAVVDPHRVIRTYWLCSLFRLIGVRVVAIDKGRGEKRIVTSRHYKILQPLKSTFDRYFLAFKRLNLTVEPTFRSIYKEGVDSSSLLTSLTPAKQGYHWIGIAPFAKHEGKIYPIEKMEKVVAHFAKKENYKIFLFGGGDEELAIFHLWTRRYANVVSLVATSPGFEVELALISQLDVMLSMDSANMHLASLVSTPVVSVWGATHPYVGFLGWNQSLENIIEVKMSCRPCSVFGNKPCWRGDYACLNRITPNDIIAKIERVIEGKIV